MELSAFYNGDFVSESKISISPLDHGFFFGEGIKISFRIQSGRILFFQETLKAWKSGAVALGLEWDYSDATIEKIFKSLLDLNGIQTCLLTMILTAGDRYLSFEKNVRVPNNFIVFSHSLPVLTVDQKYTGLSMGLCSKRVPPPACFDRQSCLMHDPLILLACQESAQKQYFDMLLVNIEGHLCETARGHIFLIRDKQLLTPDFSCGIRFGAMREEVLRIGQFLGLETIEMRMPLQLIREAEECFVASLEYGILPITHFEKFTIRSGRIGLMTQRITKKLLELKGLQQEPNDQSGAGLHAHFITAN